MSLSQAESDEERGLENSINLRLAVFFNTAVAFLAYATVDPDMFILFPILGVAIGAVFSHWRRRHSNWALKWLLAAGMLYALWLSFNNLIRGSIDPRLSLAQLLLFLQVLNSFDLPRRRNLRVALLVASTLMVVTGTLSRSFSYGGLLALFAVTLIWALHEAFASEAGAKAPTWRLNTQVTALTLVVVILFSLPIFVLAPRRERTLQGTTLPLSLGIPLPDSLNPRVRNPGLLGQGGDSSNSTQRGYNGFSERMDLNTRSTPSEELVLRVKSDVAQYWRAMAFDQYDGHGWSMSHPDKVEPIAAPTPPFRITRPAGQSASAHQLVQTFFIESPQANLIFTAWAPRMIYFPTALIWRDPYDSLRSPVTLEKDMYYSVISEVPIQNHRELSRLKSKPVPAHLAHYVGLPRVSQRTRDLSRRLTASHPTPYLKMYALANHLRETYSYNLKVAQAPPGTEWVDFFLFDRKEGFCEQFATALAVMGRLEGVPTRLVTGYVSGDYNPFTGYFEVKGKHAHAWVEAWIPSQGWIAFDATPGGDAMQWEEFSEIRAGQITDAILATIRRTLAAQPWLFGVLAAMVVALGVWLRRQLRSREPRPRPVTEVYRRVRRRLERRGLPASPSDTPRAWLEAAAQVPDVAPALPALEEFVTRYETLRFGAGSDAAPQPAQEREQAAELKRLGDRVEAALPRK